MASIDRMDWHYGGDYPENLPTENAGTHIGMFLTWIIENDLIGELHRDDSTEDLEKVKKRQMTGRDFLIKNCDEKFWEDDLNDVGNEFVKYYYNTESSDDSPNFYTDYTDILAIGDIGIYEVENSWENYDKLKNILTKRFKEWKNKK